MVCTHTFILLHFHPCVSMNTLVHHIEAWTHGFITLMCACLKVQILYATDILTDHTTLLWTNVFNINGQINCVTKMQSVGE